jgi:hypothetical protein
VPEMADAILANLGKTGIEHPIAEALAEQITKFQTIQDHQR